MATITKGYTFGATEQVTNAKLHALVDSATITAITNTDIDAAAAIATSKLADIDGSKLTGLANITSGAGVIPAANLTSVAQKGSNSDITALTGLSTPISVAQGGTGATAAANTANGVVVLNASAQLPVVDGSQLTKLVAIDSGSSSLTANQTKAISFNFTFASAPFVIATWASGDVGQFASWLWVSDITTTGCNISQGADDTRTINWIAIGTKA